MPIWNLKKDNSKKNTENLILHLSFKEDIPPENCFEALFRTVPVHRFNGCMLFRKKDENRLEIAVYSGNHKLLEDILNVLKGADEFITYLNGNTISMGSFHLEQYASLAKISNSKINSGANSAAFIEEGAKQAENLPKISSNNAFPETLCKKCGNDTENQSFCPHCQKQQKFISKLALGYLLVVFFRSAYLFIKNSSFGLLSYASTKSLFLFGLGIFQLIALGGAILLLIRYRKSGFWLLAALKVMDVFMILYVMGLSVLSLFTSVFGFLIFMFITFALLINDFNEMRI